MNALQAQSSESPPFCSCASNAARTSDRREGWFSLVWLVALWLLHSVANFWWLKADTRPPYSDTAGHAIITLRAASQPWRQLVASGQFIEEILRIQPYPPLFYVTSMPFAALVWPTVDAMLAVNTLYLGVLMVATYGIGRLLVGGWAALLAAFLVSMYPIVFGLSRVYLTDVALTAMTTVTVYCLIWSESFRRFWPSLLLGVAIGLAALTKWTFVAFFLGPLAVALYVAMRRATRARLLNIALAGCLALVVALPWYLYNYEQLRRFLRNNGFLAAQLEQDPAIWTLTSLSHYLLEATREQMLLPFCLLFVVGTWLALRRCRWNAYLLMLLAWIVVGYVVSSLFINKDTRYTMPYLPAIALLTAIGLVQIRHVTSRRVVLALTMTYALVQFVGLTVGISPRVAWMPSCIGWPAGRPVLTLYSERVHIADYARAEDWQVDAILTAMFADAGTRPPDAPPLQLVVIPTAEYFDAQAFTYARWRDRLRLNVSFVTGILDVDSQEVMANSDYVVTKSGAQGWAFALQDAEEITAQLLDATSPLRAHYALLAEFPLPDGSTAQLFRHLAAAPERAAQGHQ